MSQGELSERIHFFKREEGGQNIMCEVSDRIFNAGRQEGLQAGRQAGRQQIIQKMLESGVPEKDIMLYTGAAQEEIDQARNTIK